MERFKRKGSCKAQKIPVPFTVPADESTTGEDQHGNAHDWLVEYDGGKKSPMSDEAFQRDWQKCEAPVVRINGPFAPHYPQGGVLDAMKRLEELQERRNDFYRPWIGDAPSQHPSITYVTPFWAVPPLEVTC